jgi:hypothetical protein
MTTFREPTAEDATVLFEELEKKFPHETLGNDKWYLVAVSTKSLSSFSANNADSSSYPLSLE